MKRFYYAILLTCLSVIGLNCQKEISYALKNPGAGTGNGNPSPLIATLQGNIIDENDRPAANVAIQVGNKTVITNDKGYFRVVNASLDKNATLVTAEKTGYFKALRSFRATSGANHIMIKLIKKEIAGTVNATVGGNVTLFNGSKVALPANAVVKASGGSSYSGNINVYAAYIDPTAADIAQLVPGSFMADDKNNKRVTLSSYGMLAIELESSTGEKLQVASGSVATLTTVIPSTVQSSAPATIALWYVDEKTGIWKEEGTAVKNGNNYIGEVKHFSFWNCDVPISAVTLSLTLKTGKAVPIANSAVRLTATAAGSSSQAYGYTDSVGQVSGFVPANQSLLLEVLDPCNNAIYTKSIGPLSQNTDLGIITINNSGSPSLVTIEGQLKDCSNQPVTDGYAIINYDNTSRYISVNDKGEFTTSFLRCSGSSSVFEVIGINELAQQQGTSATINITTPVTNTGNVIACGVTSTQYINYKLEAVDYSITTAANDSLYSHSYRTQTTPPLFTWISGMKQANNDYISLSFEHDAAAGTYLITALSVQGFDSVTVMQPSAVILTNYPVNVGGFYEGTFSGQFRKMANALPVYTITGSFRIRRW
ncbi:MAG: hypothetical protein ABI675_09755 [Chitinophagaceae bacterium]